MDRTWRIGMAALAMGILAGAAGCGGSSAPSGFALRDASGPAPEAPTTPYAGQGQPAADLGLESESRGEVSAAPAPAQRPGLGTEWGETRFSQISTVPFFRANPRAPTAVASVFYNDEEGARAMANLAGFRRTASRAFTLAGGAVAVGLRDESGAFLSGFISDEKSFVVGDAGRRYTIVLRNLTASRLEAVVSVDGLDVIDGRSASFAKRGYLIDPHGELEIDGFRQSEDTVAAFRFGSVRDSYAGQKHGDTRNVGVIGVALFHEQGHDPWTLDEVVRRRDANPFPGQFATPPGH